MLHSRRILRSTRRAAPAAFGIALLLACYQDPKHAGRAGARGQSASALGSADTSVAGAAGLTPAPPADTNDTTLRQLRQYRLTSAMLNKWVTAQRRLNDITRRDPSIMRDMANGARPNSMDEIVSRIDGSPQVHGALRDAGLSAREYVVFAAAFQQAMQGYALKRSGQLPPKVPPHVLANIDFVGKNLPAIRQLVGSLPAAAAPDSTDR